jgi:hypothetical protein
MAKSKLGGARKGSGRKPVADKRLAVTLYIQESIVKSYGGIDGVREYCYGILTKKIEK